MVVSVLSEHARVLNKLPYRPPRFSDRFITIIIVKFMKIDGRLISHHVLYVSLNATGLIIYPTDNDNADYNYYIEQSLVQ
jgi:hypothetical protein